MASPSPYTKRRSAAPPPSLTPRSKGGFFFKSILFTLFLLALPLFPSQAPEFVGSETVLTKFWELIHLLFVGIAVAYGLFSRRSVESLVDDTRTSRVVVVEESSLSYVSSLFHVSSEDSSWDFRSDEIRLSAQASVVVVNERESESFNQVQAWNSQYFQGRSKVVVARPDYGLDGHVVHQPLGLPVRSLMSSLRDNSVLEDGSCDEAVNDKADKVFDEFVAAPPPSPPVVPWDFGPEMMAMGDNYLSNFQPLSVDETHYANLESRPSQSTVSSSSSSSRTSFESHTQSKLSPSHSVSEESLNSNVDEPVKEKSLEGSSRSSSLSLPPSPPPPLVTEDTHRLVLHSRHYSDGSLLEEDVRQELEDELEVSDVRGRRTEIFSKKELGSESLKMNAESSRKVKNKSRRSYPPDPISSPVDDSTTRRCDHDDGHMLDDNVKKGLESDHNKLRVKKRPSHKSLPPSPPLVIDDNTHKRVLHSRRYSDASMLGEDELERREVKGRRTEKELGSKSLKLTAESSRKGKSKSRRSYPPDSDDSTTIRRDLQHKSDDHLREGKDNIRKGLESEHNKLRVKKGRSQDSLELTAEASSLPIPAVDVPFQPKNAKASRRSSREGHDTLPGKDIKRKPEDDFVDLDKSRKKDLPGDINKEVKSTSPRREPQSWRGSSKVSSRGKSVRTIRSDHHRKDPKTDGISSHDRTEPKAESHGRTKPRRQWKEELAIVLHQEKLPEIPKPEPEDDDVTEETKVEQPKLTLEEEEEAAAAAAWESQSNASHDHYEVDRKADEFIAKFREQIRLQKLHSGEQPRGGGSGIIRNSHFR
ncbi:unnamed protein product [Eruca vesicaria subsp. sativa]|uniref:Uncharacterized protein n=1 Tax=Eruca vesicaria subsp. sativa TaxID=29727 RepID=A0ABC8LC09_ERUVS|nr:unnamed protein product [Eruca vesicaria subsp. sativa]